MPRYWRSKVLLAKAETVYRTDPTPTGGANAILATDIKLMPMEGQDVSRNLDLPYMGAQGTIPAELHQKISFKVEITPSGIAGTAPAWGVLLRACGIAQVVLVGVSVTYNPVTTAHESATIYLWIDGTVHKLRGARGTCVYRMTAQGIGYLEFEFTGLFSQATDTAQPVASLSGQLDLTPQVATSTNTPTFTIGGTALVMRSFSLNFGNKVEPRFLIGSESVLITDRDDAIETTIEATALATFNPYTLAADQTKSALILVHGTGAGRISTLAVPAAQMQRPQPPENQQGIVEWPLRLVPVPVTGNDQFTLTLT